jgi:peptidoglycan/LPS O-acetylase OafA/YrhL
VAQMKERFKALTGLRAIAAIMVFLYHNRKYWHGILPEWCIRVFNEFHTGVSLFFVLSGFLIAYTYQDAPLSTFKHYTKYLLVRLVRIFPVYLIILLISYYDNGFPSSKIAFYNYTLLKGLSDKFNLDCLPQSWSLTVELSFYVFAPLIYSLVKKNFVKAISFQLLLLLIVLGIGYGWFYINGNHDRWLYNWLFIFDSTFFGRFTEFFFGMILAKRLKNGIEIKRIPNINFTIASCFFCLLTIYSISFFEKDIYDQGTQHIGGLILRNLFLPIFLVTLIFGLITEKTWLSRILSTRVAMLLGDASYIFYLVHIGYVNRKIYNHQVLGDRNFIFLWLISIAGFLLIEKPTYLFLKRKIMN